MRHPHSFVLLFLSFLLQIASGIPQVTPPPALFQSLQGPVEEPTTTAGETCGGCIIVADVAGIVWYSEIFVNYVATQYNAVGVGNGTRVTRTSIVQNEVEFTFNPQATAPYGTTPLAVTNVGYNSLTTINGVTLTSPTAYNLYTAYTLTSRQRLANGVCDTTSYSATLSSAYTETLATASGRVYLDLAGQQGFISALGFTTCAGGGENFVDTALAQVRNLTSTVSTTYAGVALAAMSMTLAATTNPTSRASLRTTTLTEVLTTLTATLSGSSTITPTPIESANAPEIVLGNTTITPNRNPVGLPIFTDSTAFATGTGASGTGVGTGAGTGGNATVPFLNNAPGWGRGTSIWGSALLIFLMAVGWVL
ncbi:MAG: hypothetical protein Q9166_000235 [cf. Caloplaca sp. 2 TL-2023]